MQESVLGYVKAKKEEDKALQVFKIWWDRKKCTQVTAIKYIFK